MISNFKNECRQVVLDYFRLIKEKDIFRLIKEKDMHGLLNTFTDDCIIYEPFSKGCTLYNNDRVKKSYLKGSSEIGSFFYIVMMASDGLQYEIKFTDEPMDTEYKQSIDNLDSTLS